jgi:hypothetical protein
MRIGNWPLLLLAVEHIIKHKDQHDQARWRSDCGSFRCLAGWIAWFAGYRDIMAAGTTRFIGVALDGDAPSAMPVEHAALAALELDPEIYGADVTEDRWSEMESLADDLFAGNHTLVDILTVIRDLAKTDGVTPTPVIVEEMLSVGILSKWGEF